MNKFSKSRVSFLAKKRLEEKVDLDEDAALEFLKEILEDEDGDNWDENLARKILQDVKGEPRKVRRVLVALDKSDFDVFDDLEKPEVYYLILDELDLLDAVDAIRLNKR